MGKRLIQQRRGHGSPTYRASSHRYAGKVEHFPAGVSGVVTELIHCPGHSAPLMRITAQDGATALGIAPEGAMVGSSVDVGNDAAPVMGNVLPLRNIPEGTLIHNIEIKPGDGGKLVRTCGTFAKVVAKMGDTVTVLLPSKKEKSLLPDCRAAIGIVAGSGRHEKPFLKAGTRSMLFAARNKVYPRVCGISMNAVNHPFGGKGSHIKGRPTQSPRSAPPGRKVGKIAPRRTGRRR